MDRIRSLVGFEVVYFINWVGMEDEAGVRAIDGILRGNESKSESD